MMTEDCCAIFRPCSSDWLISGKSLTHRLTPPLPPAVKNTSLHQLWDNAKEVQYIKTQRNTMLSANLQPNWRVQFLRS